MVTPPPINNDKLNIERAVQSITDGTSEKYVPAPNYDSVMSDLLIGIKRFKIVLDGRNFSLIKKQ